MVFKAVGKALPRAMVAAVLCGPLAACGISQLTAPFKGGGGLFGGGDKKDTQPAQAAAAPAPLAATPQTEQTAGSTLTTGSIGCPNLEITAGEKTITFKARGSDGSNLSVLHQGEITGTARECEPSAGGMTVKYGFSGRVLLGPSGKPGTITLPAKVTVVDGTKSTLKTEKIRVVVSVPAGTTAGNFSEVRSLELSLPSGKSPQSYRIYIGFDQSAAGT